ncbi:hypothetical protein CF034_26810 [Klebsiella michiganensis]|nr:hypothetical protein [Klebsiella michiganensis]
MARSCHHNKSQHADPFIVLSIIIAGKTKYVKDPFWCQIRHKARCDKGCRPYRAFWEKCGNARTNGKEQKEILIGREKVLYKKSRSGTPVNPGGSLVAQYRCLWVPVEN